MARFTQAEKLSAKNAMDYQAKLLDIAQKAWQEKWAAASNPFISFTQWKTDKSIREAAYAPWLLAKKRANLCGLPIKNL